MQTARAAAWRLPLTGMPWLLIKITRSSPPYHQRGVVQEHVYFHNERSETHARALRTVNTIISRLWRPEERKRSSARGLVGRLGPDPEGRPAAKSACPGSSLYFISCHGGAGRPGRPPRPAVGAAHGRGTQARALRDGGHKRRQQRGFGSCEFRGEAHPWAVAAVATAPTLERSSIG